MAIPWGAFPHAMMRRISQAELVAEREVFDRAVESTPEILPFCSSATWSFAAREHLIGLGEAEEGSEGDEEEKSLRLPASAIRADTAIWRSEDRGQWLIFGRSPFGYWEPFEAAWMFGCPLVGSDPIDCLGLLREVVRSDLDLTPGFAIGGIPLGGRLHRALQETDVRGGWRRFQEFPGTSCLLIDLEDGVSGWETRRSKRFVRTLARATRDCEQAGLEIEEFTGGADGETGERATDVFHRVMAIPPKTSKWASGTDIFQIERYRCFYEAIFHDLWKEGRLRLLLARRDGEDVAYSLGGVFGNQYRGLQMSYADSVKSLGVGNWLQVQNLHRREAEGISNYDLGMDAEYKRRWADRTQAQVVAFLVP